MRPIRSLLALAFAVAPMMLIFACGTTTPVSAHATKPLDPADGAGDYENAGGDLDEKPAVPGPENPSEPSASALQPGQNTGK